MKNIFFSLSIIGILSACSTGSKNGKITDTLAVENEFIEYNNPSAEGFDQEGSDLLATLLADKSMQAMGGRPAWDNTRFISWNFFGKRNHLWDKWTGDVRIEIPERELNILMNINTREGKVQRKGQIVTDSLDVYLQQGYEIWVNDSYWLVMPYKLKDSGATLKYIGEDTTQTGTSADVLKISFKEVGVTPENIYKVWIDTDSKLVIQWAYYPDSLSLEPRFITPWADYKKYGEILLSGNRGEYALNDIRVLDDISEDVFSSFDTSLDQIQ